MRAACAAMALAAFLQAGSSGPVETLGPTSLWALSPRFAPVPRNAHVRSGRHPAACDTEPWREVVEAHLTRYPEMEVQDLYKLLHQGVFGSEHAVPDRETAAAWLREEIASLGGEAADALATAAPMLEPVAPGAEVVRVHLRPFLAAGGDPEALLDAFVATANRPRGDVASFRCAADGAAEVVRHRATQGRPDRLDRAPGIWDAFVEARIAEAIPAMHHSATFEAAYRPAYRVVEGELARGFSSRKRAP